jgi:hypothetical protein
VSSQGEGSSGSETSMATVMGDGNVEREVMGCSCFQRGRGGEDETALRCRRRMTQ